MWICVKNGWRNPFYVWIFEYAKVVIHQIYGYRYPLVNIQKNGKYWKITIFHGKCHYKWWFSIVMLNYQRVHCFWIIPAEGGPNWFQETMESRGLREGRGALTWQILLRDLGKSHVVGVSLRTWNRNFWLLNSLGSHLIRSFCGFDMLKIWFRFWTKNGQNHSPTPCPKKNHQ